MKIIKILALLSLIGSCVWCYAEPGFEPGLAIIAAMSTFLGAWAFEKRQAASQSLTVGAGGVGIQAGGNVKTGNIERP